MRSSSGQIPLFKPWAAPHNVDAYLCNQHLDRCQGLGDILSSRAPWNSARRRLEPRSPLGGRVLLCACPPETWPVGSSLCAM